MNRFERLVNLVLALYATERPLTRDEIFERLPEGYEGSPESARRAFERDKEALRGLGIPLLTTATEAGLGDDVGYRIDRDKYEVPAVDFESDELTALHIALATVRMDGAADPESALWKLGGALGGGEGEPDAVALKVDDRLAALLSAANERRDVTFRYRDAERHLEPRGIAFRSGNWYLSGFDRDRQADRNFRVDRIQGQPAVGAAGSFAKPVGPRPRPARPWEMGEGDPVSALVLVDAGLAEWAEQDLGSDTVVERRPEGSVVFALLVTNPEALRGFVLGFLDRAEILAPAEYRESMVAWLESCAG